MSTLYKCTVGDADLGKVSLFFLENIPELHVGFTTLDAVSLLYSYITEGPLLQVEEDGKVVGVAAYYVGTPERQFEDRETIFADMVVVDRAYRGTRLFYRGLRYMVGHIMQEHPEAMELRLAALSENTYVCRMYAKFTTPICTRMGKMGEETIFGGEIGKIWTILNRVKSI
jgi:hypothetical protein